jgi:hypothetical protein
LAAVRDRRYEWVYLFGAICPERQTGAAIIMPQVNVEAMNEHLMGAGNPAVFRQFYRPAESAGPQWGLSVGKPGSGCPKHPSCMRRAPALARYRRRAAEQPASSSSH